MWVWSRRQQGGWLQPAATVKVVEAAVATGAGSEAVVSGVVGGLAAGAYGRAGRGAVVEGLLLRVVEGRWRTLGADHPDTVRWGAQCAQRVLLMYDGYICDSTTAVLWRG